MRWADTHTNLLNGQGGRLKADVVWKQATNRVSTRPL